MYLRTAPGPELFRVYAYLASVSLWTFCGSWWNILWLMIDPVIRSSPRTSIPSSDGLRPHMACIYGLPDRRVDDRAGCIIAFTGVHRRSPRFRNGIAHRNLRANLGLIVADGFLAAGGES